MCSSSRLERTTTANIGKMMGATRHRHGICCPAAVRFGIFFGAAGLQFLHCTCAMRSVDGENLPHRVWPAEILCKC